MAAVVFLEIEKSSSQVFFLSLTPLMWPYIVIMTWSHTKMPFPQKEVLANSATRFRISVISVTNWPIVWPQNSKGAKQKVKKPDNFAA
jgi:hypothetical protein